MSVLLNALAAIAMCLLVPLGLPLLGTRTVRPAGWAAAGAAATAALLLPHGWPAVLLCLPYAALAVSLSLAGAARTTTTLRPGLPDPDPLVREAAALTAAAALSVAAGALVAERAGVGLFGFDRTVLRLTVMHFHYAGFAAVLVAGHAASRWPYPLTRCGSLGVPAGLVVVLGGFFLGESMELAGTIILTGAMLATAAALVTHRADLPPTGRRLLTVAGATAPVTMTLALSWAAGEAASLPHLTLGATAASHGLANALGIGLSGLAGWRAAAPQPL